jgi:hypothetical protein
MNWVAANFDGDLPDAAVVSVKPSLGVSAALLEGPEIQWNHFWPKPERK